MYEPEAEYDDWPWDDDDAWWYYYFDYTDYEDEIRSEHLVRNLQIDGISADGDNIGIKLGGRGSKEHRNSPINLDEMQSYKPDITMKVLGQGSERALRIEPVAVDKRQLRIEPIELDPQNDEITLIEIDVDGEKVIDFERNL